MIVNKIQAKMISASTRGYREAIFGETDFTNRKDFEEAKTVARQCGKVIDYGTIFVIEW
jgi:hypothetical protein